MRVFLLLLSLYYSSSGAFAEPLKVMTFNVRYPEPRDGENYWEVRKDLLVKTIKEAAPDIIGTQELVFTQGEYIVRNAPEYAWFGISRRGNREDEHMGVFYRKDKFKVIESGNFWLSETPEKPGSISWDMSLPRMVTWALMERAGTGTRFYFYNTHFPHRREDDEARLECAKLLRERIEKLPANTPLILTGDFNAPTGGEVHQIFERLLQDAWLLAKEQRGPETTLSGWKGRTEGPRIDWILVRGVGSVTFAETVTKNRDGRYPSDHYPVLAGIDLN